MQPNVFDAAVRLAECDAHGVDVQVLSTVPVMFHYWAPPHAALEMAQFINDDIASTVRAHPTYAPRATAAR